MVSWLKEVVYRLLDQHSPIGGREGNGETYLHDFPIDIIYLSILLFDGSCLINLLFAQYLLLFFKPLQNNYKLTIYLQYKWNSYKDQNNHIIIVN